MLIKVFYYQQDFDYNSTIVPRVGEWVENPYNGQLVKVEKVTHKPSREDYCSSNQYVQISAI